MEFNLPKLEYTIHLLWFGSSSILIPNYANSPVTQKEKAFLVIFRNYYVAYPHQYPANYRRMEWNVGVTEAEAILQDFLVLP